MKIYHNPRCRKSRETLDIIKEKGIDVEVIEYLKHPMTEAELKDVLVKLELNAVQLIRKGEGVFKELYKGKDLSENQWIKAMVQHPVLMERPIVVKENMAVLGRPPENVKKLF
jgi:arsenate reductase